MADAAPSADALPSAGAAAAAAAHALPALSLADFVPDDEPSAFLKLSMSRRVKEARIAEPKLRAFLTAQLAGDASAVLRVAYGAGARRSVLVEFASPSRADTCRSQLHGRPCALLEGRAMYAEFALQRTAKEARDELRRVPSASRALSDADPGTRVPGLRFWPSFVSSTQEAELLAFLDRDDGAHWHSPVRARQVQHFGFAFNYETRRSDSAALDVPPVLARLAQQVAASGAFDGLVPDQITVNEYLPGQGIAAHIDTHAAFMGAIASLSLASEVVMEFRAPCDDTTETLTATATAVEPVLLPPRSLVIMTGASRYAWTHAIPPRTFDVVDGVRVDRRRRLSVTLRKVQHSPCVCAFPVQCAAQQAFERERLRKLQASGGVEEKPEQQQQQQDQDAGEGESLAPTRLEREFVHAFYETVADHFSSTRYKPWPRIQAFVQELPTGALVADLGCGNGKYMLCAHPTRVAAVGGDRSARLAHICGARGLNALVCDAMRAPIRSASCDAALSVAVLHHLSTESHRVAAVRELVRVLRVGGRGVVYAWAHEQQRGSRRRFDADRQDFMVPWNLDKRFARDAAKEAMESKEAAAVVVQRYCHMFKQGELERLVELAGGARVEESYYDESNWAVVLQRVG